MWQLVFSEKFDYETVFHGMTMNEVDEATAALAIYYEDQKKRKRGRG